MKNINELERNIFNTLNTFTFSHNIKTTQLYILNLIVLFVNCNSVTDKNAIDNKIYSLVNCSKFNFKTFLKRYVIQSYFSHNSNNTLFNAIMQYFEETNYFDSELCNKKIIRYIQQKRANFKIKDTLYFKNENDCIVHINL